MSGVATTVSQLRMPRQLTAMHYGRPRVYLGQWNILPPERRQIETRA
jgi:hypothetical protein